jgi:hypothetical protein
MQTISVVALGVYRHVAASTDFQGGPYRVAAILDLTSEPPAFNYNPHNLGVVLHTLHPRPQVFVTGAAIAPAMTNESIKIWETYVKTLRIEDTLIINVRVQGGLKDGNMLTELQLQGDPPKDGNWRAEIMRKLDEKYRPAVKEL